MSGQWEIVGRNKKDKQANGAKKLTKSEKKKFVESAPKVEDLLPLAQVKTLYAALDTNKEPNNKVPEKTMKSKESEAKKVQKKQTEKKKEVVKEKPPKTLEAAVSSLIAADVKNVIEIGQLRFQEAPLVWLKGLASFLNTKLPVDYTELQFTAKSFEHPVCLLAVEIKNIIKKAIRDVSESTVQLFFDYCLTVMANDMSKGSPVSGYKILLQLTASQIPSVTVANLPKSISLRNSYQNRQAIGSSVLWALGQGGFKDLSVGLKVWQDIMLPLIELRNYSRFVLDYLKYLLARHSTSKALTSEQYFSLFDSIFLSSYNLSNNASAEMRTYAKSLQMILCNVSPEQRLHNYFEPLLKRIRPEISNNCREELVSFLGLCLCKDHQSYSVWRQLYTRHLPQSAALLRHLHSGWNAVIQDVPQKILKDTVITFKVTNDEMAKTKQKSEGLQECSRLCEAVLIRMTVTRSFPWKGLSILLLFAISGLLFFDINKHGSFRDSSTGRFLKDIGALNYYEKAWNRVQIYSFQAYIWSLNNLPYYYEKTNVVLSPYLEIIKDITFMLLNYLWDCISILAEYVAEKIPVITDVISAYFPGILDVLQTYAVKVWDLITCASIEVYKIGLHYVMFASNWAMENIFVNLCQLVRAGIVILWNFYTRIMYFRMTKRTICKRHVTKRGNLSPENLHRYTMEALNKTHSLTLQTIAWIGQKV